MMPDNKKARVKTLNKINREQLMLAVNYFAKHPEQALLLLGLSLFIVGRKAIYEPKLMTISVMKEKVDAEKNQEEAITEIRREMQKLNTYASKFPSQSEQSWWLDHIAKVAKESNINIQQLAPQPVEDLGNYMLLAVNLEIKGKFANLGNFVAHLEGADKIVRVDELHILRTAEAKTREVKATIRLTTVAVKQ